MLGVKSEPLYRNLSPTRDRKPVAPPTQIHKWEERVNKASNAPSPTISTNSQPSYQVSLQPIPNARNAIPKKVSFQTESLDGTQSSAQIIIGDSPSGENVHESDALYDQEAKNQYNSDHSYQYENNQIDDPDSTDSTYATIEQELSQQEGFGRDSLEAYIRAICKTLVITVDFEEIEVYDTSLFKMIAEKVLSLTKTLAAIQSKEDHYLELIDDLNSKIKCLKQEINAQKSRLDKATDLSQSHKHELNEYVKSNQELIREKELLERRVVEEVSALEAELVDKDILLDYLKSCVRESKDIIQELLGTMSTTVKELDLEHKDFIRMKEEHQQMVNNLQNKLYLSQQKEQEWKDKAQKTSRKFQTTSEQLVDAKKLIETLKKSKVSQQTSIDSYKKTNLEYETKIKRLEGELTSVKNIHKKNIQNLKQQHNRSLKEKDDQINSLKLNQNPFVDDNREMSTSEPGIDNEIAYLSMENQYLKMAKKVSELIISNNLLAASFHEMLSISLENYDKLLQEETIESQKTLETEIKEREILQESDLDILLQLVSTHKQFVTELVDRYTNYEIKYGEVQ